MRLDLDALDGVLLELPDAALAAALTEALSQTSEDQTAPEAPATFLPQSDLVAAPRQMHMDPDEWGSDPVTEPGVVLMKAEPTTPRRRRRPEPVILPQCDPTPRVTPERVEAPAQEPEPLPRPAPRPARASAEPAEEAPLPARRRRWVVPALGVAGLAAVALLAVVGLGVLGLTQLTDTAPPEAMLASASTPELPSPPPSEPAATVAPQPSAYLAEGAPLPISFDKDGYTASSLSQGSWSELVEALGGCERVVLTGHTCSLGEDDTNHLIGLARAEAVRDALIAEGMPPRRLSIASAGSSQPIVPNDTEAHRTRNRRVTASCAKP